MDIHLLLLVIVFSASSISAQVFISIDCGASDSYTDGNSIPWSGDKDFFQDGVTQVVQSSNSMSHVMDTLRVFTARKKNCYSINAEKGGQILVRASFYYGNYDKKSSPPSFDLQFDGNHWTTVVTSSTELVFYEAVYIVKGDTTSVCVAQTKPDQFPFISALEFRSLGIHMYNQVDSNYAMFTKNRVSYGSNASVRFPDDAYDRIWGPGVAGNGLIDVSSDAIFIETTKAPDEPPEPVMKNAITTSSSSAYISLGSNSPVVSIYILMYFSEVIQLDSTQKRSFTFYENNQSLSDPIIPPYVDVFELYYKDNSTNSSSSNTFSLRPTTDSTLPPLINAIEVYLVSDALTDGTDSNDVTGLSSLQTGLVDLQQWSGDPCLPSPFSWEWISCNTDASPRVTALHLSSFGLSGPLPDFSSMDALETIDMHNNSLSGPIPDFLGTLPNLKQLNLADNKFSGDIPTSLSNNNNLKLVITGNPDLCTAGKSCETTDTTPTSSEFPVTPSSGRSTGKKKKSNKLPAILGGTIPSVFVIWAIAGYSYVLNSRRKRAAVVATGANGMHNRPNGTPPQGTKFNVNIEEQVNVEINVDPDDQQEQQNQYNATNI
ncbi:uncharacterized protein At1g24485-like [Cornus florida]|uniref:uncharacterized protein At1g24485-like n=1 Tax=Cornus florida TaxID=4283 RepID=UPI00289E5826|nr:uncharacterized protein At1g24485-like [Cornus florida]